ncbi:MAG: methyltransferase [Boseongicola sp. SB0677_bin_26]|nr:methyltransferase [Boseongicola sp. SB0665_bin_10]MYG26795.1 methyltransferase [Boseongicola sp. SB0677_bin_26]
MSNIVADAFLGGRLRIRQPVTGYRAGSDPVFLAASVPASPGDSVLDLGTGAGTALLCLMARVPDLAVTGIDCNPDHVSLARDNLGLNRLAGTIVEADIACLPGSVTSRRFDHVMFNPPYFDRRTGSASPEPARETSRSGETGTEAWIDAGLRRARPGGTLTFIQRIEHLPRMLAGVGTRLGGIRVLPMQPRRARPAKLFILQGRTGSKGRFRLLPPIILHEGDRHHPDGGDRTEAANAILRDAAALALDG